ncbi:DUF3797 domain-containing protein [Paenibacillus alvei]|uniref:DUF3797 domain-containing protein n=1 Tax=Paenibacillus alvei TaxID=44250 RepID=UPI0018CDA879|nr:DUF3797 domain-containing protein [Paenibacillus alvei]MBG9737108.1 hypothetical protein [Paenibacillus alvei]MBG9742782.1 hypothetical protein [Paenibacillus alvei]MBG9746201.1 hypothetical protein [Paenibacillus alvei]MCY9579689.1 DUF3797 domain-containing protein [Paenibacillus alvei]MCY9586342.1 DUF3797 domain-containing protein [Paenibacillus alvei]
MDIRESSALMKKYNTCPECGNDKIGGTPSQGTLTIEDEVFTRSCKCGWRVVVDRRIKCCAYATYKTKGKTTDIYEVSIHGQGHKYLPLNELKELSGVKRVNHTAKIEEWLNTTEGRNWALKVAPARLPQ